MNFDLFLIFRVGSIGRECCTRPRRLARSLDLQVVSGQVTLSLGARQHLLLAIDHRSFVLRPEFVGRLRTADLPAADLRLAHLMVLLRVVIALLLSRPQIFVAAKVLLPILNFDLKLLGGSGHGHLRVQGLPSVEGAVELL